MLPMLAIMAVLIVCGGGGVQGLMTRPPPRTAGTVSSLIPKEYSAIVEPAAQRLLEAIESVKVKVPASLSPSTGVVETTFAKFSSQARFKKPPLVLLHGFDSSSCEYRRLAPLLAEGNRDVYVPDLFGWGFTQPPQDAADFGPLAKMEHLRCFIRQVCGKGKVVVVGASLGGALAITLAADSPDMVERVVLIDAQGFIDGKGPNDIPDPLARLGVNVLKSTPLRMFANLLAYRDKRLATLDAMRVGKLHCLVDSWEQASVGFLKSGGFVVSDKVARVRQETLLLWGRNDEIIEPSTAQRFVETMPRCRLQWIEECGHVPHLEQPALTARLVNEFLS